MLLPVLLLSCLNLLYNKPARSRSILVVHQSFWSGSGRTSQPNDVCNMCFQTRCPFNSASSTDNWITGSIMHRRKKNSLPNHYDIWEKTFWDILKLIKTGYNIPTAITHRGVVLKNNKSVLQRFAFDSESIEHSMKGITSKHKRTQRTTIWFFNILRKNIKFDLKFGLHHINICKEY